MNEDPEHPVLELVITAHNRAADLEASVRRLHAHLAHPAGAPRGWRVAIVDNASTDGTALIGRRLARDPDGVRLVQLRERTSRRDLRQSWAATTADVVAFADVTPTTDLPSL